MGGGSPRPRRGDGPAARRWTRDEGADKPNRQLLSCMAEGGEPDMLPEGFGLTRSAATVRSTAVQHSVTTNG